MRLAPLLLYGGLLWTAAIVAAPFLAASESPSAVAAGSAIYRGASVVCHQISERSFHLSGLQLAVCARCFGLYVGASAASILIVGMAGRTARSQTPGLRRASASPARARWIVAGAALPTLTTWTLEQGGLWPGTNLVRFACALPLGFAAAWIVLAAVRGDTADPARLGSR